METALTTISPLPSTKEQVQKFVKSLKDEILANTRDPLPVLVQLTCIERMIKDILTDEDIEYHFRKEFQLYDKEKVIQVSGAKLQEQEVGVKYRYEDSGDPVWFDLAEKIKELSDKKKEREKFLQNLPYESKFVDPDSGAFITRPPKESHSKVIVKLI